MGARERRKGAVGEREVVRMLESRDISARRNPQPRGVRVDGPDIAVLDDCHPLARLHLEVRRRERGCVPAWLADAESEVDGQPTAIVHRRNGEKWSVTLRLGALLDLLEEVR